MIQAGVIVPVTEATPWIKSYVIIESEGRKGKQKLWICLDPTPLNKAVIREPYHTWTPEDIYHHLHKAKYITIVDFHARDIGKCPWMRKAHTSPLFNTPFGWYHFTCLPFGINVSGDAFQRKLDTIYNPLPNVNGIADDLIIWGNKDDGSDHDEAITKLLHTAKENGLKITIDKIQYKAKEVSLVGETYITNGHRPSAEKIKAIQDMAGTNKCHRTANIFENVPIPCQVLCQNCCALRAITDNSHVRTHHLHGALNMIKH